MALFFQLLFRLRCSPLPPPKKQNNNIRVVAERILEAHYFACDDPYRAVTNNKGIMNGIDAVAIATGQDWRAIEAAAHAHACQEAYTPLTRYWIESIGPDQSALVGHLDLPISIGTVGGALKTHPKYAFAHKLLGYPDSKTLAQIIVSVGLAQNFAALRALAIEGIQKGHMSLHAKNVALASGCPTERIDEVVTHMIRVNKVFYEPIFLF